jgi:PTS system nitrogen regulatory IIA component
MTDDGMMTLQEVAGYLQLSKSTVQHLMQRGELPANKMSGQWRVVRAELDDWLKSRMQTSPESLRAARLPEDGELPPLSVLIRPELMVLDIAPGTKEAVLGALVAPLVAEGLVADGPAYVQALVQREEMVSTAVGQGIALPHVRHPKDNPTAGPLVVAGRCPRGTDFAAIDGEPVLLFWLVVARDEVAHVRIMAMLARLIHQPSIVGRCLRARTPAEIVAVFATRELPPPRD